jgi:EmrB/QacA subfamily drug resistance transporter
MTGPVTSRPRRSPGLALAILCAATLMIILDGTIVTVALPSIQRDLGFPPSSVTWVLNAYLIAFGGLLLLAGRLGDLIGRKRMFLSGLAVFTVASLLCGLSAGPQMLIAARFAQGIGGAMVAAVSLGMIVTLYPQPPARARAIGAYSFVGAAGASIGLLLGGVLTEALSWHWIFFVNLPIGAAAGVLAGRVLNPDRGIGLRAGADGLGAVLVTAGLMAGVYAIIETAGYGWGSARTLGPAAAALALLGAFIARQATAARPLLPLRIFSSRNLSGANVVQLLVIAAAFAFQVLAALYIQRVLGYAAAAAGVALVPVAAVIGAISLGFSARLGARFGERGVLLAGLTLIAAALTVLTRVPVHGGYLVHLLPPLLLFGLGGGLTLPMLATLGMSGASADEAGVASGLFNTTQQIGAALGLAALSALAAARTSHLRAAGLDARSALAGGYRLGFGAGACLSAVAIILTITVLRRTGSRSGPDDDAIGHAEHLVAGHGQRPGIGSGRRDRRVAAQITDAGGQRGRVSRGEVIQQAVQHEQARLVDGCRR